jgi:DNA-binding transcriptional regulator YiaG
MTKNSEPLTNLAVYRQTLNLSRTQMADMLGLNIQTYRNYERGDRPAPGPVDRLLDLLQTLDAMAPDLADLWRQSAIQKSVSVDK